MFLQEARISARLAHPNAVHVYEVIEHQGVPTLVMEYLEGQPLWSIVRNPSLELPRPLHLRVLAQVAAGLHAAHELRDYDGTPFNLIHRDVSPHNVFLLFDGQVKVLDFGIAKASGSEVETRAGELKGKVRYMPPEQLIREKQDRRVDVFAVGVMLWEALAGRRYWGDKSETEVIDCLLRRELPELPDETAVPPELAAICRRALAPSPCDRYETAGALQHDLEDYLAGQQNRASAADLGAFLCAHFGAEREDARRVIEAHVRAAQAQDTAVTEGATRIIGRTPGQTPAEARRRSRPRLNASRVLAGAAVLALIVGVVATVVHGARPGAGGAVAAGDGTSAPICPRGSKACAGECVSVDRPDLGCGDDACHACNVTNATSRCNLLHRCDIAVCYQDYDDCDGDSSNGCETNVRIDPDHCGGCGRKCPALPHAQRGCGDACTIWRCDNGYRDCDGAVDDGCEVGVLTDPANCGDCGHACKPGQRCRRGECS
jgi:hypothetical protein